MNMMTTHKKREKEREDGKVRRKCSARFAKETRQQYDPDKNLYNLMLEALEPFH